MGSSPVLGKLYIKIMHDWNLSPSEAIKLQKELSCKININYIPAKIKTIAGVDVTIKNRNIGYCIIAILNYDTLEVIDEVISEKNINFPYIPGLLSFREGPIFIDAYKKLNIIPDLFIFDGQGIAHPRQLGLASHMGLLIDKPSIGCAKSRLIGEYVEPGPNKGDSSFIYHNGKKIGIVLRTRSNVKPVFVSPGHKITFEKCKEIILKCTDKYRIPKPTRYAHNRLKKLIFKK